MIFNSVKNKSNKPPPLPYQSGTPPKIQEES